MVFTLASRRARHPPSKRNQEFERWRAEGAAAFAAGAKGDACPYPARHAFRRRAWEWGWVHAAHSRPTKEPTP